MKILGLSAGNPGGSADILLTCALQAAEADGAEVAFVSLADLDLAQGPDQRDDAGWFWELLLESTGFIVSTPIYSRTVPGKLRLLGDRISGPQADAAFTAELLRLRAAGQPVPVDFAIDERVLRPRVAGFLAVGGSVPTHWKSLALPMMHTLTASMQIAVADQVQFAGAGSPSSIVLDPSALDRAGELGHNVAGQLGKSYDDVTYLGAPGSCPMCHLDVIVVLTDGVECASCGAAGAFHVVDGQVRVEFTAAGRAQSILTLSEKLTHFHEVQRTAAAQALERETITARAGVYTAWDRTVRPPR